MSGETEGGSFRKILHRLSPFLVTVIFAAAAFLLYRQVRQYSPEGIKEAVLRIPRGQMLLSFILMIANYVVLIGYDLLAVKSIGHPLPLRRIALASFTGFATSYSFGALLGGGSVRYRLYSAWGLSAAEIVQLIVILGITFWFGVFALAGIVFVWQPLQINAEWNLPFTSVRPLGWFLILLAVGYLALTVVWKKPIRIRGREARLPGFRMSAAQLSVAAGDLVVAAACFYVLLPPEVDVSYVQILGVYLLAVVAVVLTHVPGGAAVFELFVLGTCPVDNKEAVLAAILAFRVIYYLLPLLTAAVLMGLYEIRLRSRALRRQARKSKS